MQRFNFSRLIKKNSREFTVIVESNDLYDKAGEYIGSETVEKTLCGAILGISENKVNRSEGNLSQMDMALHMLEPIDNALMGATVIFEGNKYTIDRQKGQTNAVFTGVYSYTLKWVSAFKEGGE